MARSLANTLVTFGLSTESYDTLKSNLEWAETTIPKASLILNQLTQTIQSKDGEWRRDSQLYGLKVLSDLEAHGCVIRIAVPSHAMDILDKIKE